MRRVAAELDEELDLRLVEIADADDAIERRFLGSPTVRVKGMDVEPGAEDRRDYVFACRVYRSTSGLGGRPEEAWIRSALLGDQA